MDRNTQAYLLQFSSHHLAPLRYTTLRAMWDAREKDGHTAGRWYVPSLDRFIYSYGPKEDGLFRVWWRGDRDGCSAMCHSFTGDEPVTVIPWVE